MSALSTQEGGNHYKDQKIQPVEYIHANGIGYFEGCVIKYVSRWKKKNGIEDLKKARHFIELLIELEQKRVEPVEWPEDESRIDVIGQNGPSAIHYGITNPPAFVLGAEEMKVLKEACRDHGLLQP